MLQHMITVISGMKDRQKLGKLHATVIKRICEVSRTDPVWHLQLLADQIGRDLTHEEADVYAVLVMKPLELGRESFETIQEQRQLRIEFAKRYPNWDSDRSAI